MRSTPEREPTIVETFLASSWHAEAAAAPVVDKLLRHPCSAEEQALLVAYAREEDEHAALLDDFLRRRGLVRGEPFWIQRVFHLARSRPTLLLQFYNVELLAGAFYGAMASRTQDPEAKALIRRLLRDEARHIRLHRMLLAREAARLSRVERLKMRALAFAFRVGMAATARFQARQLAPVLGDFRRDLPRKIERRLRADLSRLFGSLNADAHRAAWAHQRGEIQIAPGWQAEAVPRDGRHADGQLCQPPGPGPVDDHAVGEIPVVARGERGKARAEARERRFDDAQGAVGLDPERAAHGDILRGVDIAEHERRAGGDRLAVQDVSAADVLDGKDTAPTRSGPRRCDDERRGGQAAAEHATSRRPSL